jgi:hypothetical protein
MPKSPQNYMPNSPQNYMPNSPQNSFPNSPQNSFPNSPQNSPPLFQVNDFVTFNGDFKPDRIWKITEFDKGFAVLETDDKEGLTSNLKVVALSDIKRFIQRQPSPDAMGLAPTPAPPPITVNVISGDNNTMETPKQKTTEEVDFSEPRIRFKEPTGETSETKSDISDFSNPKSIVVKKV